MLEGVIDNMEFKIGDSVKLKKLTKRLFNTMFNNHPDFFKEDFDSYKRYYDKNKDTVYRIKLINNRYGYIFLNNIISRVFFFEELKRFKLKEEIMKDSFGSKKNSVIEELNKKSKEFSNFLNKPLKVKDIFKESIK